MYIDPKAKRQAAEILRERIKQLKRDARTLFGTTDSAILLRIRDLEAIAQKIEDDMID